MGLRLELQRLHADGGGCLPSLLVIDVGGLLRHAFEAGVQGLAVLHPVIEALASSWRGAVWVISATAIRSEGVTSTTQAEAERFLQSHPSLPSVVVASEPVGSMLYDINGPSARYQRELGLVTAGSDVRPYELWPLAGAVQAIFDVATGKVWDTNMAVAHGHLAPHLARLHALVGAEPGELPLGSRAAPNCRAQLAAALDELGHIGKADVPKYVLSQTTKNDRAIVQREVELLGWDRSDLIAEQVLLGEMARLQPPSAGVAGTTYVMADIERDAGDFRLRSLWLEDQAGWRRYDDEQVAAELLRRLVERCPERWFLPRALDLLGWMVDKGLPHPVRAVDPGIVSFVLDPDHPSQLGSCLELRTLSSSATAWLGDTDRLLQAPADIERIPPLLRGLDLELSSVLQHAGLHVLVEDDLGPTLPALAHLERQGAWLAPGYAAALSASRARLLRALGRLEKGWMPVLGPLDPYRGEGWQIVQAIQQNVASLVPDERSGLKARHVLERLGAAGVSTARSLRQARAWTAPTGLLHWLEVLEAGGPRLRGVSVPQTSGRWGFREPSLHALPKEGSAGRVLRSALLAPPGYELVSVDYNAFEARLLADLSGDPVLVAAAQHRDMHTALAGALFSSATAKARALAKAGLYAVIYGQSQQTFWIDLPDLRPSEALWLYQKVTSTCAGAVAYQQQRMNQFKQTGQVVTNGGWRRRPRNKRGLPEGKAVRQAFNTLLQGLGADIFRRVLRELHAQLPAHGAFLVHHAHDEFVAAAPPSSVKAVGQLMVTVMTQAPLATSPPLLSGSVPLYTKAPRPGGTWWDIR